MVVSALARVTDALLEVARLAERGDAAAARAAVRALRLRHEEMTTLVRQPERRAELLKLLDVLFAELEGVASALAVVREVSPRSCDALVAAGELASSRIVAAALAEAGLPSRWLDARDLLVTDAAHGAASPDRAATDERLRSRVSALLQQGLVAVTGGFVGATASGVTTTLGRGGSDYSAALFGAGLAAEEIQIWTDVDGMLTADPRLVPAPRVVTHLSFAEASELAYFGAKVLHPSTILPAVGLGIPVRILNSHRPRAEGTLITASLRAGRPGAGGDRLPARRDAHRHHLDADADGLRLPAPGVRGLRALRDSGRRGHDLGGERVGDDRRPPRDRGRSRPSCARSRRSRARPAWRS